MKQERHYKINEAQYLDEAGLEQLWEKIKQYISENGFTFDLSEYAKKSEIPKDTNTTYDLTQDAENGYILTFSDSNGNMKTITIPTSKGGDTITYKLIQDETDGHILSLQGSDGSNQEITIPDKDTHQDLSQYALKTDIPVVPEVPNTLPNPFKLTLTGAVSAEYDGSKDVTVDIPAGSSAGGGGGYDISVGNEIKTDKTWDGSPIYLYILDCPALDTAPTVIGFKSYSTEITASEIVDFHTTWKRSNGNIRQGDAFEWITAISASTGSYGGEEAANNVNGNMLSKSLWANVNASTGKLSCVVGRGKSVYDAECFVWFYYLK